MPPDPLPEPTRRSLVAIERADDGFVMICDCGSATHVVTVDERRTPTPMEFAVTCDGCGTSHWFQLKAETDA